MTAYGKTYNQGKGMAYGNNKTSTPTVEREAKKLNNSGLLNRKKYVPFFGRSSNFPEMASVFKRCSPTQLSIVNSKVNLTLGDGIQLNKSSNISSIFTTSTKAEPLDEKSKEYQTISKLFTEVNINGQNILEIYKNSLDDYYTIGNGYILLKADKLGNIFIYHLDGSRMLVAKKNDKGEIESCAYCANWKDTSIKETEFGYYPNWLDEPGTGLKTAVIHIKDYSQDYEYYGLPESVSGLAWQSLEYRVVNFNIGEFDRGFMPGVVVQGVGGKTPEEKQKFRETIVDTFIGDDKGKDAGLFAQLVDNQEAFLKIDVIKREKKGDFIELLNTVKEEIITANRWSASLAGVKTSGALGSNQQIMVEYFIAMSNVVNPVQNLFVQKFFKPVLKEMKITGVDLAISNSIPVQLFGTIDVNTILTEDEKRAILGYNPKEKTGGPNG